MNRVRSEFSPENQVRPTILGGRSSRFARRSVERLEVGTTSGCPPSLGGEPSIETSAATLKYDPSGAERGAIGSPQGAEFKQGFLARSAWFGVATFNKGFGRVLSDPQQHEAPRHFEPHLQALACDSASNIAEPETLDP
jgi:hypothetical protein